LQMTQDWNFGLIFAADYESPLRTSPISTNF